MKKTVCTLLALILIMSTLIILPVGADYTVSTAVSGYDISKVGASLNAGTYPDITKYDANDVKDDYEISTPNGLKKFSDIVNGGEHFDGTTVHLVSDLDMSKITDFLPIGFNIKEQSSTEVTDVLPILGDNYFSGTFNGHGNKIDNLKITVDSSVVTEDAETTIVDVGLFGLIGAGAQVKNFVLGRGCEIKQLLTLGANVKYTGSVVGRMYSDTVKATIIYNVYSKATVSSNYGAIGGIVGAPYATANDYIKIENCTNAGTVSGTFHTGGIVGYVRMRASVYNCRNTGYITSKNASNAGIGGIVGSGFGCIMFVDNCINNGKIESTNTNNSKGTGGIFGHLRLSPTINFKSMCYNYGKITVAGSGGTGDLWGAKENGTTTMYNGSSYETITADITTTGTDTTYRDMLSMSFQLSKGVSASSESTSLRFISSVDDLNYTEVGFKYKFEKDGKNITVGAGDDGYATYKTLNVYSTIKGAGLTYTADEEFAPVSEYFITMPITGLENEYFGMTITVYAYAVLADGSTVITGTPETVTVNSLIAKLS